MRNSPTLVSFSILAALAAMAALSPRTARAVEHPTLVDVDSARCDLCHEEILQGKTNVHGPAADDCTTCHAFSADDEGTQVELMDSEPALCVICHDDLTQAVEFELETPHFPVGDSCLTCHDPHASENAQLLLASATELCAECHDIGDLGEVHDGQLTEATNCASCHAPHGSDNALMLVAAEQHAPFADGSCTGCHREPFGDRVRLRARGQRLCIACHGEFPEHEAGSVHAALEDRRGRASCLSCHDPHMSDHGALLLESGNQLCAECHAEIQRAAEADTGHFPAADDCGNCHRPHTSEQPNLLATARQDLCADCHDLEPPPPPAPAVAVVLAGAGASSYGPAPVVTAARYNNGTAEPGLCAAPFPEGTWSGEIVVCDRGGVRRVLKSQHVAAGGAGGLILANRPAGANDLFADAHAVPTIHIKTAEGASVNKWLAQSGDHVARITDQRLVLAPTTPPKPVESDLTAAHLGADLTRLDCLECHSPHGAGNPSALAKHLHFPLEDGCDTCHDGAFDEFLDDEAALCLMCHDGVAEQASQATVPHDAMDMESCVLCHNPHASPQEKLVNAPGAGPCADCHEQAAGPEEVGHGVIDALGCRACHEPHGSENEKLLRRSGEDLCFECHLPGRAESRPDGGVTAFGRFTFDKRLAGRMQSLRLSADLQSNHPVNQHRTLGTPTEEELKRSGSSFAGELTCTVCHDPHKGRSSRLFQWDAAGSAEVCLNCHDK